MDMAENHLAGGLGTTSHIETNAPDEQETLEVKILHCHLGS